MNVFLSFPTQRSSLPTYTVDDQGKLTLEMFLLCCVDMLAVPHTAGMEGEAVSSAEAASGQPGRLRNIVPDAVP